MHNADTISVIMACYNCEATLAKALDSILAQTHSDWIVICCDDGSEDRSYEILLDYRNRFPDKFLILRNEKNCQLPYSLNRCLEKVTTELVARMDADDQCHPERFEKQLLYLREHPECDMVGTGIRVSDGNKIIGTIHCPAFPTKEDLIRSIPFPHPTIMTYKRVYDALGGYATESYIRRVEDVDLWFRFFAAGFRGHNLPEELYWKLEDDAAIRKRTLSSRINRARVAWRGYRMLGFPKRCYFWPLLSIAKGLLPPRLYRLLHGISMRRTLRS